MIQARFRVRGRVQGVGFRWFVRERARELRLGGWVRNLPDGSVEVAVAGAAAAIERMREALGRGPEGAVVSAVDEGAVTGDFPVSPDSFTIVR